MGIILR